jgi:hypothetical protein
MWTSENIYLPGTSVNKPPADVPQAAWWHHVHGVAPVETLVIGSGKRLFSEGTIPSGLQLVDSKVSTTGVVIGTYEPAGEIVTGSFALD